jgi:hypothetical protein
MVALQKVENPAKRAALAMMTMGDASLLQTFDGGIAQIQKFKAEADRFGLTLSQGAARALDEADDAMKAVSSSAQGAATVFASALAPAIVQLSIALIESIVWIKEHSDMLLGLAKIVAIGGALYIGYAALPVIVTSVAAAFTALGTTLSTLLIYFQVAPLEAFSVSLYGVSAAAVAASGALGALKVAAAVLFSAFLGWEIGKWFYDNFATARTAGLYFISVILKGWEDLKFGAQAAWAAVSMAWQLSVDAMMSKFGEFLSYVSNGLAKIPGLASAALSLDNFGKSIAGGGSTISDFSVKMQQLTQEHQANIAAIDKNISELIVFQSAEKAATKETENHTIANKNYASSYGTLAGSQDKNNKLLQEAKQILEHVRTPQETYAANIERINLLLDKGYISYHTYSEAVVKYKQDMEDSLDSLAKKGNKDFESLKRSVEKWGDSFTDAMADFVQGKNTFSDVIDSILSDIAKISIKKGITDPILNSLFGDPNKARDQGLIGGFLNDMIGGSNQSGSSGGSGGGFLSSVAKFFGFANGGIMSSNGSMPLKRYATGGIANSPQMAMFGEGRMPEAYVPLPDGRSIPVTMSGSAQSGQTVKVEIINQTSNDARVKNVTSTMTPQGLVTQIFLEDIKRGGPISGTLGDTFNLKRDGRVR